MAEPRPLSGRDVGLVASAGAAESQRIDVDTGIGIAIGGNKNKKASPPVSGGAGLEAGFDPGIVVAAASPTRLGVWVCGQDSNRSSANGDN